VAETDDLEEDHPGAPEEAKPGERAADGARDPEPEGPGKQTGGAQEPGIFTLKHLDEVRTVGRDEVVRLAQQGMDYDRVRSERDQLRKYRDELGPALEMVRDFAGKSGLAPEEYLELCRRRELSGRGMDGRGVNERVFSERREAFLRSGQAAREAAETRRRERAEKRREDMRRFAEKFPAVKPEEISKEIWDEVAKGESLLSSYTLRRNARLEAELTAERQNRENAQKTTGSLSGGLAGIRQDEFDRWWNDED
jgi:hypothetical protein